MENSKQPSSLTLLFYGIIYILTTFFAALHILGVVGSLMAGVTSFHLIEGVEDVLVAGLLFALQLFFTFVQYHYYVLTKKHYEELKVMYWANCLEENNS